MPRAGWSWTVPTPHTPRIGSRLHCVRWKGNRPLRPWDDVNLIVDCLAGTAIAQRDLLTRLHEREDTCELLSEDQARVLDLVNSNTRLEIRGGAGSGKTWLGATAHEAGPR